MYFKQFYLGCLAHASYLIGSEGEAVVVDPQRDVISILRKLRRKGLKIKYVIETHLHADFVSGHRELAARTGAEIVFGEKAGRDVSASGCERRRRDQDRQSCIKDSSRRRGTRRKVFRCWSPTRRVSNQPQKVLTGDTLFVGDVGRPDLGGRQRLHAADRWRR